MPVTNCTPPVGRTKISRLLFQYTAPNGCVACRSAKSNLRSGRKTPAPVFTDSGERSLRVAAEKPRSQSRNSHQNKYYATYHFTSAPRITSCRAHRCAGARVWAFSGCGARWRVLDLQLLLSRQPILAAVPAVTATRRFASWHMGAPERYRVSA